MGEIVSLTMINGLARMSQRYDVSIAAEVGQLDVPTRISANSNGGCKP